MSTLKIFKGLSPVKDVCVTPGNESRDEELREANLIDGNPRVPLTGYTHYVYVSTVRLCMWWENLRIADKAVRGNISHPGPNFPPRFALGSQPAG